MCGIIQSTFQHKCALRRWDVLPLRIGPVFDSNRIHMCPWRQVYLRLRLFLCVPSSRVFSLWSYALGQVRKSLMWVQQGLKRLLQHEERRSWLCVSFVKMEKNLLLKLPMPSHIRPQQCAMLWSFVYFPLVGFWWTFFSPQSISLTRRLSSHR
jgi:hypothetical protein